MSEEDPTPEAPDTEEKAGGGSSPSEQLEEALREKDQFRAMAQRAQADLINYRRRAAEELRDGKRNAKADLLLKMLSPVDDLERALSHIPEDAFAPALREGLSLVQGNLISMLESEGVTKIDAAGRQFQPWEFEAVLYEESLEADEGEVIRVVREGYRYREKVLRAAQVIVAKTPQTQEQPDPIEEGANDA
jgi:molecular chaperone GrpE